MSKPISYRLGELFCGPGGLGRGAFDAVITTDSETKRGERAGIRPIWASDKDEDSCNTYRLNNVGFRNPEKEVICCDVKDLVIEDLPYIDGFAYGFPCNDFSQIGKQKGMGGKYGRLYRYGVEVLNYHKPTFFVAENVSGIKSTQDGNNFAQILDELAGAGEGYSIVTHLYNANDYGVAQNRKRIIMVGIKRSLELEFKVPAPGDYNPFTGTYSIDPPKPYVPPTAGDVLEKPYSNGVANHEMPRHNQVVIERLKLIKPGENAWTADLPEHLQIKCEKMRTSQIYRRLERDKPSYTVTGSGGGGNYVYHYDEPRALTNRERARLQGFSDDYVFTGKRESIRKQIGMAVPPPLSRAVFIAVLKTLHGVSYPFVESNQPEARR